MSTHWEDEEEAESVTINVTAEDIAVSNPKSGPCPITRAMRRTLPDLDPTYVYCDSSPGQASFCTEANRWNTPARYEIVDFLDTFYDGEPVDPIVFCFPLGDQVLSRKDPVKV